MGIYKQLDGRNEGNQHGHGTLEHADGDQVMHDQFGIDPPVDHPDQDPDHIGAAEPDQHGPDERDIREVRRLVVRDGHVGYDRNRCSQQEQNQDVTGQRETPFVDEGHENKDDAQCSQQVFRVLARERGKNDREKVQAADQHDQDGPDPFLEVNPGFNLGLEGREVIHCL